MTVSSETKRVQYDGNDVTVEFAIPFYFFVNGDINVYLDDTLLTLTTHYTVADAGEAAGGTLTMITAPATGETLTIIRNVDLTQGTDYVENSSFPANSHEDAIDRLTMISQQLQEQVDRSIVAAVSSEVTLVLPAPSARKALVWNTGAANLENSTYDPDTAQADAEAAQAAAEAAQAAAEIAETNAETAETNAETAETNAAVSAAEALASANSLAKINLLTNSCFGVWSNGSFENGRTLPDATTAVAGTTCTSTAHALIAGKLVKDGAGVCFKVVSITDANIFEVDRIGADNGSQWYEAVPGCVAADALGPDWWSKTATLDIWRQHLDATYTTDGSFYSVKVTKGSNDPEYLYQQFDSLGKFEKFLNRVMALGASMYSVTATDNVKIAIYHNGAWSLYPTHAGADAWEWQEITQTINSSSTDVRFGFCFDGDSGDVAYVQIPMCVFGSSIGSGNYVQPPGEVIALEASINLFDYNQTAKSTAADVVVDLEAQSNGKLPKGLNSVDVRLGVNDSGSSAGAVTVGLGSDVSVSEQLYANIGSGGLTLANDKVFYTNGRVECNADGRIEAELIASGAGLLDVFITIFSVEIR